MRIHYVCLGEDVFSFCTSSKYFLCKVFTINRWSTGLCISFSY